MKKNQVQEGVQDTVEELDILWEKSKAEEAIK